MGRCNCRSAEESTVWLVEVIPAMTDDHEAGLPTYFNPGISFRFPLALIAGNFASIKAAIQRDKGLAEQVVEGRVLLDQEGVASALVDLARSVSQAA